MLRILTNQSQQEANLYQGQQDTEQLTKTQDSSVPKKKTIKKYNPFTITNGISYDFDTTNKMNQQVLKKFSMSLKNVNPIKKKKLSNPQGKNPLFSLTETGNLLSQSPERSKEYRFQNEASKDSGFDDFNMYKKNFFEKRKDKEIVSESMGDIRNENGSKKNKEESDTKLFLYERKKNSKKYESKFVKKSIKSNFQKNINFKGLKNRWSIEKFKNQILEKEMLVWV